MDYGKLIIHSLEQKGFLRNMDKILIQNLRVQGILGVNDWERTTLREIVVNVTLFTDTSRAAQSDDISNCVDYSQVAKEIRSLVEGARRFTVEALAEDIAVSCLSRPGIRKVTVRVEKPGAVKGAESVGVEIERGV
ncbi:MAG: dihydroneopterin aldolase [Chloroflexi bacterium]|nr:dihydroneopterin aldolase [Chloroflexota bacterium]